jgi:hypothetical protein
MGSIKILQMDKEGVDDRVYRLHYNTSQKRTDTFSAVSSSKGAARWRGVYIAKWCVYAVVACLCGTKPKAKPAVSKCNPAACAGLSDML